MNRLKLPRWFKRPGLGVILLLAGLSGACSTPKTYFHTLNIEQPTPKTFPAISKRISSLGLGRLDLPVLLDRQGMVLRTDAFTVDVSDQHVWGGELEDELLRSLERSLQVRLPVTQVQTAPWELEQTPQQQISLNILQFDGVLGQPAVLRGNWRLQQGVSGKLLKQRSFSLTYKTADNSVGALVRAQSQLVNQLAEHIIKHL